MAYEAEAILQVVLDEIFETRVPGSRAVVEELESLSGVVDREGLLTNLRAGAQQSRLNVWPHAQDECVAACGQVLVFFYAEFFVVVREDQIAGENKLVFVLRCHRAFVISTLVG